MLLKLFDARAFVRILRSINFCITSYSRYLPTRIGDDQPECYACNIYSGYIPTLTVFRVVRYRKPRGIHVVHSGGPRRFPVLPRSSRTEIRKTRLLPFIIILVRDVIRYINFTCKSQPRLPYYCILYYNNMHSMIIIVQ